MNLFIQFNYNTAHLQLATGDMKRTLAVGYCTAQQCSRKKWRWSQFHTTGT